MTFTFNKVMHGVVAIAVIVVGFLLIRYLSPVLLPFLVAWFVAYLLNPIVKLFQRLFRTKKRALSVIIVLVLAVGLFTGLGFLLVPMIGNEVKAGQELITNFWEQPDTQRTINHITHEIGNYFRHHDPTKLLTMENIEAALEKLLPGVAGILQGLWSVVAGLAVVAITLLYLIFIMLDYDRINQGVRNLVPNKYRTVVYGIIDDVEMGMNSYFRGQFLVAMIVGILFAIGFSIIGLPLGITIGLFIGLLNIVPYLQTLGILPVALLALLYSFKFGTPFWIIAVECAAVFIIVQAIQDLLLVPKIMGHAMGLKPAIILLSLSVWGSLLGLVGMIIALPLTSLMISYYKRYVVHLE